MKKSLKVVIFKFKSTLLRDKLDFCFVLEEDSYDEDFTSGATPRTPKKTNKNRAVLNSDDEIEDNLSYVEESSKVI